MKTKIFKKILLSYHETQTQNLPGWGRVLQCSHHGALTSYTASSYPCEEILGCLNGTTIWSGRRANMGLGVLQGWRSCNWASLAIFVSQIILPTLPDSYPGPARTLLLPGTKASLLKVQPEAPRKANRNSHPQYAPSLPFSPSKKWLSCHGQHLQALGLGPALLVREAIVAGQVGFEKHHARKKLPSLTTTGMVS